MGVKLARVIYGFLVTVVTMHSYVINSYTVVSINSIKKLAKKNNKLSGRCTKHMIKPFNSI